MSFFDQINFISPTHINFRISALIWHQYFFCAPKDYEDIRSGGQQLTSGFSGANIGMASVQLGGEGWKSWDNAYLNIVDTLPHVTHCDKEKRTITKFNWKCLNALNVHLKSHCLAGDFVCLHRRQLFS